MRCAALPEDEVSGNRSTCGVTETGLIPKLEVHPDIDIARNLVVFFFAFCCDVVDIGSNAICRAEVITSLAECFDPGFAAFFAASNPCFIFVAFAFFFDEIDDFCRNGFFDRFLTIGTEIKRCAGKHTGFIFYLNSDECLFFGVDLCDVLHNGAESPCIGISAFFVMRGKARNGDTVDGECSSEAFFIFLYPKRAVTHIAVFPGSKPKQNEVLFVFSCLSDKVVDHFEIKLTFFGLDLIPIDRDFHCVCVHEVASFPSCFHFFCCVCTAVVCLYAREEDLLSLGLEQPFTH